MSETKTTTLRSSSQTPQICRLIFCRESPDVRGYDVLMQLRSEQDHEGTSSAQGDGIWDLPGANLSDCKHLPPFQAVLIGATNQMAGSNSFQLIEPFLISANKESHPHLKDAITTEIKITLKEPALYTKGQLVTQGFNIGTIYKLGKSVNSEGHVQTLTVQMKHSKWTLTKSLATTINNTSVVVETTKEKKKGGTRITMPTRLLENKPTSKYVMSSKGQEIAFVHIVPKNHPENWVPVPQRERNGTNKIKGYAWLGVSKITDAITNSCKLDRINLLGSGDPVSNETFLSTNISRIFRGNGLAKAMMSQSEIIKETGSTKLGQDDRLRAEQWCNELLQHEINNNGVTTWSGSTWKHVFKGSWQTYGREHGLSKANQFKIAIGEIKQKLHDPETDNTLYNLVNPPNNSGNNTATSFVHALPYLSLAYIDLEDLFMDDAEYFLAEYVSKIVNGISISNKNSTNGSSSKTSSTNASNNEDFQFDPILFYVGSRIVKSKNLVLSNALLRTFALLCPCSDQWLTPEDQQSITSEGRQEAKVGQQERKEIHEREEKEKDDLTVSFSKYMCVVS